MSIACISHFFQDVSFFQSRLLALLLRTFYLSWPVEDKFFWSDDSGIVS